MLKASRVGLESWERSFSQSEAYDNNTVIPELKLA